MGLNNPFSSKTETVVGTATIPIMDAGQNPVYEGILLNILTSEVPYHSRQNINSYLQQNQMEGYVSRIHNVMNYARDHYTLGLPSGITGQDQVINRTTLESIIKTDIAYTDDLFIQTYNYTNFTPTLAVYEYLYNTLGYDSTTGVVTNPPAAIVFGSSETILEKRILVRSVTPGDEGFVNIEYEFSSFRPIKKSGYVTVDGGDGSSYSRYESWIEMEWISDVNSPYIESVSIPVELTGIEWNSEILSVFYYKKDNGGYILPTRYIWIYVLSDETYSALDPDDQVNLDEFLPVVPLRYNNVDLTSDSNTSLYNTSNILVRKLGMNLKDLGDIINSNPDVAEIDHAYLMFGVNLQTNYSPALRYLADFFELLRQSQLSDEATFNDTLANPVINEEPTSFANITRSTELSTPEQIINFKEHGLNLGLGFDYITVTHSSGSLNEYLYFTNKKIESYEVTSITTHENDGGTWEETKTFIRYKLILKTQIGTNTIREVTIYNPKVVNTIYGNKNVVTTLEDVSSDSSENNFIIPLQYNLTRQYNYITRNVLYADSTLIVINSIKKVKVKWYERSWFKAFVMIVAMVVSVWSFHYWIGAVASAWATGVTIAGVTFAAGWVAVAAIVATSMVIGLAVKAGVDWIIKNYGEQIGIIGAIVMTIAAIVLTGGRAALGLTKEFAMTAASYLLQGAGALISSANEFLAEKGQKLEKRYLDFVEEISELWESIEEAQDLLQMKSDFDPIEFIKKPRLQIVPNESPTVFFSRCLNLVDNTMHTIHEEIHHFHDMRLRHDRNISTEMYGMNSYV